MDIEKLLNGTAHFCFSPAGDDQGGTGGGDDNPDGGDDNGAGGDDQGGNDDGAGGDDNNTGGDDQGGDNKGGKTDSLLGDGEGGIELALDLTEKPEGLDDEYWDSENNQLNVQKLYDDKQAAEERAKGLRDKLSKGQPKPPENAEDYKLELPEELQELVPADDPLMKKAQEHAHKLGMSQENFQEFIGSMIGDMSEIAAELAENPPMLTDEQKEEIKQTEYAKIGANAPAVIRAVETFGKELQAKGVFSESDLEAFKSMAVTGEQVRALNKMRGYMGGSEIPMDMTTDGLPSDEEIYSKMEAANTSGDAKALKEVDELLDKRRAAGRPETLQLNL